MSEVTKNSAARRGLWASFVDDPADGPLPLMLLGLTALTGLIDAVSVLGLGRVFVANMTGNIVFIGFALAHAPGFSLANSLAALAGFIVGAFFGGEMVKRFAEHRGRLLRNACCVELVLVGVALALAASSPHAHDLGRGRAIAITALCAWAMGTQNTTARRLAVADLTTTVLTMTITGIAADLATNRANTNIRRVLAVLTMCVGAIVGAVLVLHASIAWALAAVVVLLALVTLASALVSAKPAAWQHRAHA